MSLFEYPKSIHARKLSPRQFRRYQSYKPYLRLEFSRRCVYCRQPDSSAPNLNFGVDHYRPKSIRRFAGLVCIYSNLFYCCAGCNCRKGADWPVDENAGPFVVNPCDYEMFRHLRFDSRTARVEARTSFGRHTIALLQLNEPASVQYRSSALLMLKVCDQEIDSVKRSLTRVRMQARRGLLSSSQSDEAIRRLEEQQSELQSLRDSITGDGAPPMPRVRWGSLEIL